MKTIEIWARTNEYSYLNDGERGRWVKAYLTTGYYPSGCRECVQFPSGFRCKVERCEIVQVIC